MAEDVDQNGNKKGHLVFVYGTLKNGYGNNRRFLSTSTYHGPNVTGPYHKMVRLGGFPGVVFNGGYTKIHGEVFEVSGRVLRALDALEGYPDFYDKEVIMTPYGKASMYVLSNSFRERTNINDLPAVEDGIWTPGR